MAKKTKDDFAKAIRNRPRYAKGGRVPDDWKPKKLAGGGSTTDTSGDYSDPYDLPGITTPPTSALDEGAYPQNTQPPNNPAGFTQDMPQSMRGWPEEAIDQAMLMGAAPIAGAATRTLGEMATAAPEILDETGQLGGGYPGNSKRWWVGENRVLQNPTPPAAYRSFPEGAAWLKDPNGNIHLFDPHEGTTFDDITKNLEIPKDLPIETGVTDGPEETRQLVLNHYEKGSIPGGGQTTPLPANPEDVAQTVGGTESGMNSLNSTDTSKAVDDLEKELNPYDYGEPSRKPIGYNDLKPEFQKVLDPYAERQAVGMMGNMGATPQSLADAVRERMMRYRSGMVAGENPFPGTEGATPTLPAGAEDISNMPNLPWGERELPETAQPKGFDTDRAGRIADAYDAMGNNPNDPEVQKAYQALKDETMQQYQDIKNQGLQIEKIQPGEPNPYPKGSKQVAEDVNENNHLYYLPTKPGDLPANHPLAEPTSETIDGEPLSANDIFRIVHDVNGHAATGASFGPKGEEQAWQAHMPMYSPEAQKALTTETRGQNSWVNYGPMGEANRANPSQTTYAQQKAGILPDWTRDPNSEGQLVHYSQLDRPLDVIDPAYQGTGKQGAEAARPNRPKGSLYYESGTPPEDVVTQGAKNVYTVNRPQNILNLNTPEGQEIINKAHVQNGGTLGRGEALSDNALDDMEKEIKSRGYAGFKNPNGPLPNAVKLFIKRMPISQEPVTAEHFEKLGKGIYKAKGGRVNYDDGGDVQAPPATPDQTQDTAPPGLNDAIAPEMQQAQYQTPGQELLGGAEAVGKGLLGPVATGAERLAGVTPEAMAGREQAIGPAVHYGLELAGLAAPAIASLGTATAARAGLEGAGAAFPMIRAAQNFTQAGILGKIGEAGAGVLGATNELGSEAPMLAKIGSAAVKGAIETAAFQSGDEMSKAILGQYNNMNAGDAVQTAAINVGLSGLMGAGLAGGIGAAAPIWQAVGGPALQSFLGAMSDKMNGEPLAMPDKIENALQTTGVQIAPEIRAAMSGNAGLAEKFNVLREVKNAQVLSAIEDLHNQTSQVAMDATGLTPDQVKAYSVADQGRSAMDTFVAEHQAKYQPIQDEYNELETPFQSNELPKGSLMQMQTPETVGNPYLTPKFMTMRTPALTDSMISDMSQMAQKNGYNTVGTPHNDLVNKVINDLSQANTVQDLSNINTRIGKMTDGFANSHLWNLASEMKGIITNGQNTAVESAMANDAPELLDRFRNVKGAYRDFSQVNSELSQNLGLGKTGGPKGLLAALEAKRSPEEFLNKLSPRNNAELLPFMQKNFPETLSKIQQNELMQLTRNAVLKGTDEAPINLKTLQTTLNGKGVSPELRNFAFPPGALDKINAAKYLQDALPAYRSSGTAGHLNSIMSKVPGSALAATAALTGHNPIMGFVLGHLGKLAARDVPDAVRLATLRFLGSDAPIDSEGFKTMTDFIYNSLKGADLMARATKNVFKAGAEVLPSSQLPSDADRARLDKMLKAVQVDQSPLTSVGGRLGHYMPDHSTSLAQTSVNGASYLNSLRPQTAPASPLDGKMPISSIDRSQFNRALDIAQQPLNVVARIKDGSLTPADLTVLKSVYPNLYNKMSKNLTDNMTEALSRGVTIPYKIRLSLSLFLGQALDSTMTPQAIMAAQPQPQMAQPETPTQPASRPKKSMNSLNKLPNQYQTPMQAAESDRGAGRTE